MQLIQVTNTSKARLLRGLGLAILASHALHAAVLIDQVSPGGGSNDFGIESTGLNGQSFTPAQSNLAGFGLTLKGAAITTSLTVEIWDRLWTAPGAVRLVQQTAAATTTGGGFLFNDIFWTPVGVTPGQRYFARLFAANNTFITGGFIFNPYAGGTHITNNNPGLETGTGAIDITFRTYYESDFQSSGVPEPSAFLMVASGVAAVVALGWKGIQQSR